MAINYPEVLKLTESGQRFSWSDRDTMLYALAIGMGSDPLDPRELPYVYEKQLRAVPTLATVIAWGAGIGPDRLGIDRRLLLHGEERLHVHAPLPVAGEVVADSRVLAVYDKGDKGAVIERETILSDAKTGTPIATLVRTAFARGAGNFGGPSGQAPVHEPPRREPDRVLTLPTRRDQALLYRLCGDRNPLHADPAEAKLAGFDAPILHGLCTYGMCCRAVLEAYCEFDPARLGGLAVRFSAAVMPGDVIAVSLWRDGAAVSFEATVPERAVTVIKNGRADIRG